MEGRLADAVVVVDVADVGHAVVVADDVVDDVVVGLEELCLEILYEEKNN